MSTIIYLVEDDPAVTDSLRLLLEQKGWSVRAYESGDAFFSSPYARVPGVVVSDVRMPGRSGIELTRELKETNPDLPVILITGHGDIEMAVSALKAGAVDFIEKPLTDWRLFEAIEHAFDLLRRRVQVNERVSDIKSRIFAMPKRQREVMDLVTRGLGNKEIAKELSISPRTVEVYRAWVMERMGARNVADLVRMAIEVEASSEDWDRGPDGGRG